MTTDELIHHPGQISAMLERLQEQRTPLKVVPGRAETRFDSAVLDVFAADRELLLEQLAPQPGHALLLEHRCLLASAELDGVEVRFETRFVGLEPDRSPAAYRMTWPQHLRYLQKRSTFRVRIGMPSQALLELERRDGSRIAGKLVDLSQSGVGVELQEPIDLHRGEILPCQLVVGEKTDIACKLEIRYVARTEAGKLRFGGRILDLNGPQHRGVKRLVAEMQREWFRRQQRD